MKSALKLFLFIFILITLSACQSDKDNKWKVAVDLSPEAVEEIQQDIEDIWDIIDEQIEEDGSGEAMAYISIANHYLDLGDLRKAVNIYKGAIESGVVASSIHNNLARIYEQVGEYDEAIEEYEGLVDKFQEKRYLYDITWAYIRLGDWRKAEKYFNDWQRAYSQTDENTQQAIKKLRDEEKK